MYFTILQKILILWLPISRVQYKNAELIHKSLNNHNGQLQLWVCDFKILQWGFENLWLQALQLLFLRYTLILDCNTTSVGDTHPKTQIWSLQAEVQLSAPVSPDAS